MPACSLLLFCAAYRARLHADRLLPVDHPLLLHSVCRGAQQALCDHRNVRRVLPVPDQPAGPAGDQRGREARLVRLPRAPM